MQGEEIFGMSMRFDFVTSFSSPFLRVKHLAYKIMITEKQKQSNTYAPRILTVLTFINNVACRAKNRCSNDFKK